MTEANSADRVLTILKNCSTQLRRAHSDLGRTTAPIDSLMKIIGVADALDAVAAQVRLLAEENEKHRRTTGGLVKQVHRLQSQNIDQL